MLLSNKFLKTQSRHRPDDSEKMEDLYYQLNSDVDMKSNAQNVVVSLQSQLHTVHIAVDSFHRRVPSFSERMRTHVTDKFGGFLCTFQQRAQKLFEKQKNNT